MTIFSNEELAVMEESCNIILNEATTQEKEAEVTDKFVTKLFRNLKNITSKSDYKLIDASRGNIEKLSNYADLYRAELLLHKLITQSSNDKELVNAVGTLQNTRTCLIQHKVDFMKGYSTGNLLIQMAYKTVVANYITSMGALIANGISVGKDSFNRRTVSVRGDVDIKAINKSMKTLRDFNSLVKSGQFNTFIKKYGQDKKTLSEAIVNIPGTSININYNSPRDDRNNNDTKKTGLGHYLTGFLDTIKRNYKEHPWISSGITIITVLLILLGFAYNIYSMRIKLSLYLEEISVLLEVSAEESKDPKIKARQEEAARIFKTLSDKIAVDNNVASEKSEEESKRAVQVAMNDTAKETKKEQEKRRNSSSNVDDDEIF